MKIGIEFDDNYIYLDENHSLDNIGANIELKEYLLNMAMEYIDKEKIIAKYNYNKKYDIKVKRKEYKNNVKPAA